MGIRVLVFTKEYKITTIIEGNRTQYLYAGWINTYEPLLPYYKLGYSCMNQSIWREKV